MKYGDDVFCDQMLTKMLLVLLQGKLAGYGIEEQLPTVVVVAHYDAYGIAPVSNHPSLFCAAHACFLYTELVS